MFLSRKKTEFVILNLIFDENENLEKRKLSLGPWGVVYLLCLSEKKESATVAISSRLIMNLVRLQVDIIC